VERHVYHLLELGESDVVLQSVHGHDVRSLGEEGYVVDRQLERQTVGALQVLVTGQRFLNDPHFPEPLVFVDHKRVQDRVSEGEGHCVERLRPLSPRPPELGGLEPEGIHEIRPSTQLLSLHLREHLSLLERNVH